MSLLVSAHALGTAEYGVWGGGGGDAGLLPLYWSFSHQGMGFGCLEVVMRNQWNWDFF